MKRDRKFGRGESITWFCDQLVIPPVPPSCLIGCNIISIKYTLEVNFIFRSDDRHVLSFICVGTCKFVSLHGGASVFDWLESLT